MSRQMERELEQLDRDLEEGRITQKEYNAEIRAIQRADAQACEENAREAYERAKEQW
jgi:hypothetical protein